MTYRMYIGLKDNSEVIELPVLPKSLPISHDGNSKTHNIVNFGEIIVPEDRKLLSLSIESFFPKYAGPYVTAESHFEPKYYVEKLLQWKTAKKILRIVICGSATPINILCLLEQFEFEEKAGQPGDIFYKMNIKEYREFSAQEVSVISSKKSSKVVIKNKAKKRTQTKEVAKKYIAKKGDTLFSIAKKELNDGNKAKNIQKENNIYSYTDIYAGKVIKLPDGDVRG